MIARWLHAMIAMLVVAVTGLALPASAGAYVYWENYDLAHGTTIGRATLDGTVANESFIATTDSIGVAVDGQHIYWANTQAGTIGRASLDGTGVNPFFVTGAIDPLGVAVDGQHIYWTNQGTESGVGRANLDGSAVDNHFITGGSNPGSVAVDGQHIYWSNPSAIGRANLDGTSPDQSFISLTGVIGPNEVAVDGRHIYWTSSDPGLIGRANLDGSVVDGSFIRTGDAGPLGVAVDGQHIYWANPLASTIGRANLDGSSPNPSFIIGPRALGLAVDALPYATTTSVACSPLTLTLPAATSCTATVTDLGAPRAPTGTVAFSSTGAGAFGPPASCSLVATTGAQSQCQLTFLPSGAGSDTITGTYSGDVVDAASSGTASFTVLAPPSSAVPPLARPSNLFALSGAKLNRRNGSATLIATVPGAGTLLLTGPGIKQSRRFVSHAGTVKLAITGQRGIQRRVGRTGKAHGHREGHLHASRRRSEHAVQEAHAEARSAMSVTSKPRTQTIRRVADQMAFRQARLTLAGLFLAAILVMPGAARASSVEWTVCASGCNFTTITDAVTQSNADDLIEVMPGTYPEKVVLTQRLHIFAPADGPRPVITWAGGGETTFEIPDVAAGTTVHHLEIRATGTAGTALEADGAVTAIDLSLASTAPCAELDAPAPSQLGPGVTATSSSNGSPCVDAGFRAVDTLIGVTVNAPHTLGVNFSGPATLTDSTVNGEDALFATGGTVRRTTLNGADVGLRASSATATLVSDSVITSTTDGATTVVASGGPGGPLELRNVTVVAAGSSSTAIGALQQAGAGEPGAAIDARNVIARGTANGAFGEPETSSGCGGPCAPGLVTLGYSNVNDPAGVIDTTTIGHNQIGDPLLVNPVVGPGQDFHIASADSPAIGAGTPDPGDGPTDRDGVPHRNPPSIGAYEFVGSGAPPGGGTGQSGGAAGNAGGAGGNAGGTGVGATKPTISLLSETNRVFAVGRASTTISGRTAAARTMRGTVFSFVLDRSATVRIAIRAGGRGRRGCRSGATKVRVTRRCMRATTVVTLTRSGHAGLNRVSFSGRIGRRALAPGGYEAAFTAINSAGSSSTATLHFRVVR